MAKLIDAVDRALLRDAGLPQALRQSECDGPKDQAQGATEVWAVCGAELQERIALQFVRNRAETVRDALLDGQLSNGRSTASTFQIGQAIWRDWIDYRDRVLCRLCQRGRFIPR